MRVFNTKRLFLWLSVYKPLIISLLLTSVLTQEFYEFNHIYASFTDIFDTTTVSDDFAGPVFEGEVLEIKSASSGGYCELE